MVTVAVTVVLTSIPVTVAVDIEPLIRQAIISSQGYDVPPKITEKANQKIAVCITLIYALYIKNI
ncbi:MAG: hypothetical protein GX997_05460 [Bacteroidales bacterium]|nr:hypothetical protein [Bacteroidales bacterium]